MREAPRSKNIYKSIQTALHDAVGSAEESVNLKRADVLSLLSSCMGMLVLNYSVFEDEWQNWSYFWVISNHTNMTFLEKWVCTYEIILGTSEAGYHKPNKSKAFLVSYKWMQQEGLGPVKNNRVNLSISTEDAILL